MTILRTLLFTPADHQRRVESALSRDADAVILDLEDAVAVQAKPAARAAAVAALRRPRACSAYVRVNALPTEWSLEDITAVVLAETNGIILPKTETPSDIATADWLITALERSRGLERGAIDLIPLIETGRGISGVTQIAAAANASGRVKRMAFGAGDYVLDVGLTWSRDEMELLPARSAVVLASRVAGLDAPIDTVWTNLEDADGFHASSLRGRQLGFQGRLCIHPTQVTVANGIYTPSEAEVAQARAELAAFKEAEAAGIASIRVGSRFVDYPIAIRAEQILAKAALVEKR